MQIYFVYDGWDDDSSSVWHATFYATKELAEVELERKIEELHEKEEVIYQRKLSDWRIKQTAVDALLAVGLPIPSELSWVNNSPPTKKKILNHGLEIDYIVVNEE